MHRLLIVLLGLLLFIATASFAQDSSGVSRYGQISNGWQSVGFVHRVGDLVYVPTSGTGLRIVDIYNPYNPTEIGFYDTPGLAREAVVVGNYCYVADDNIGIQILNISNPSQPQLVGSYTGVTTTKAVTVVGTTMYVAGYTAGLHIVNVSNPSSPQLLGSYNTPGFTNKIIIQGNYAYLAEGSWGIRILDISNPSNPTNVGMFDTQGVVLDIALSGNTLIVPDGVYGVKLLDVSNPAQPSQISSFLTTGNANGVDVFDNTVYVAAGMGGLRVLSITNQASPVEIGYYNTPGVSYAARANGSMAFLCDGFTLYLMNCSPVVSVSPTTEDRLPIQFKMEPNYPNPFNHSTRVQIQLQQPSMFTLSLYNTNGQQVAVLANERQMAGVHTFDLRMDALPSGQYLLKATANHTSQSRWITYLK